MLSHVSAVQCVSSGTIVPVLFQLPVQEVPQPEFHHPPHHEPSQSSGQTFIFFHIAFTVISLSGIDAGNSGSHLTNSYHILIGSAGLDNDSP